MTRIALLAALALLATLGTEATPAGEAKTLKGQYVWNFQGSPGDLDAVFTPTGEQTWEVAFHFEFNGSPHVYRGTAEGSLATGPLTGEVNNEGKSRTFTFDGKFEDGTFRGTHQETTGGRQRKTGTLTLDG